MQVRNGNQEPLLLQELQVAVQVVGKGWERGVMLVAQQLYPGEVVGVSSVRIPPLAVRKLNGVLEVRGGEPYLLRRFKEQPLQTALSTTVDVAFPALELSKKLCEVPRSSPALGAKILHAGAEEL